MHRVLTIVFIALVACSPRASRGLVLYDTADVATLSAGDNNNWSAASCNMGTVCSIVGDASGSTITGIDQSYHGDRNGSLWLYNRGSTPITFAHNRTSSTQNRLHLRSNADIVVAPGYTVNMWAVVDWTTDPYTPLGWYQLGWNEVDSATIATPSRTLGTAFQPSTSRLTYGCYSVRVDGTVTISGGATGRFELLSDTANPPTTVRGSVTGGINGTAVVGLSLSVPGGGELCHLFRPGDYGLLRGVNVVGTPTFTLVNQTEETL